MKALITNKNNPSVIIVTGSVKNIRIGFTINRNMASTTATITAEVNPPISTPGRI